MNSLQLFLPCAAGVEEFLADEVHHITGLTGHDLLTGRGGAAKAPAAGDTVVMASSEKLGAASPYVIAPLDAAATVLVAPGASKAALAPLRKAGAVLVVA